MAHTLRLTPGWFCIFIGLVNVACIKQPAEETENTDLQSLASDRLASLPGECQIALTFDDGPSRLTSELARKLRCEHDISATFFVTGEPIKRLGEGHLDEMRRYGHLIANHTFSHPIANAAKQQELSAAGVSKRDPRFVKVTSFTELDFQDKVSQVQDVHNLIKDKIFGNVFLFRSPANNWNSATAAQLNPITFFKYYVGNVSWDVPQGGGLVDFQCWGPADKTPKQCAESYWQAIRARNKQGSTVLLHDLIPTAGKYANQHYTMEMVLGKEGLIQKIKGNRCVGSKAYSFVRLDQTKKVQDLLKQVQVNVRAEQRRLGKAETFSATPGFGIPAKDKVCARN